MHSLVTYLLEVAVGLGGGILSVASFHRRNPGYRDAPSFRRKTWAFTQSVWMAGAALGVGALIAWPLGELNGAYLFLGGTFAAVNYVGLFVWPIFRASHRSRRPVGGHS